MAGKCQMESLKNGALDLTDIALLNDAMAVDADNRETLRKIREAEQDGR